MNRVLKIFVSLCCLVVAAATLVSCGAGNLPEEDTLRVDFENYLNYYGELPFTYNFKTFEVKDKVKNNEDKTGVVTIETSVERLYNGEIYNDITYVADIHYADIKGEWNHEHIVIKSSIVALGFDLESVFLNTSWVYNEDVSNTKADKLEDKGVPKGFDFNSIWDKDTMPIFIKYSEENEFETNATFRGMEAYVAAYGDINAWDFRIVYVMDNGAAIDFVHVSGSIYDAENWVIGYRENTGKEKSLAIYGLEPVEE